MNPPNLWEELARYGSEGMITYCQKLYLYRGINRLVEQAFRTPLDPALFARLQAERREFAGVGCSLLVQMLDSVLGYMSTMRQLAHVPSRPLGKPIATPPLPQRTPTTILAQARDAAARGQTTYARVFYNQYVEALGREAPGRRPEAL